MGSQRWADRWGGSITIHSKQCAAIKLSTEFHPVLLAKHLF